MIFYYYNSVAEHPLVLHPLKLHEAWRYITYFLVHVDFFSLFVNLFVQLVVGVPLELVHGSFRIFLIYSCGVMCGSLASSIFDPYVRLAGNFLPILYFLWTVMHAIHMCKKANHTAKYIGYHLGSFGVFLQSGFSGLAP